MTNAWTDNQIINAIRTNGTSRRLAEEYLYKTLSKIAVGTILKSGGRKEEIDEAFPDAFVDMMKQVEKPNFKMTDAKLSTYFMKALLRNWRWNKVLIAKKQEKIVVLDPQDHNFGQPTTTVEEDFIREERRQKVRTGLEKLGARCKKLLSLFSEGFKMAEIAVEMGFKSEDVAKNEVGGCRSKLRDILRGKI